MPGPGTSETPALEEPLALTVELLYDSAPTVSAADLLDVVRRELPDTVSIGDELTAPGDTIMLAHREAAPANPERPLVSAVFVPTEARPPRELGQSWTFAEAQAVDDRCAGALSVVQMFGLSHPAEDRLRAFRSAVLAACELTSPVAAWWPGSTQMTSAPTSADGMAMGLLNARLFRIEGTEGDVVMDTLGLQSFGLPDVQIHSRGLEPGRLAGWLLAVGAYLLDAGDVIADGNTVQGLESDQQWSCRHEDALVGPERIVLDVNPGAPYAAGNRI